MRSRKHWHRRSWLREKPEALDRRSWLREKPEALDRRSWLREKPEELESSSFVATIARMFNGHEIESILVELGISHVVWLPDSVLGPWETALEESKRLKLIRVCREGEAWPIAAGLAIGGKTPIVVIQTTGLFESGDALRNVLFDLGFPVFAIVGARSWLNVQSKDTARRFAIPILDAWGIEHVIVESPDQRQKIAQHYQQCQAAGKPGMALIAEGRM